MDAHFYREISKNLRSRKTLDQQLWRLFAFMSQIAVLKPHDKHFILANKWNVLSQLFFSEEKIDQIMRLFLKLAAHLC